MGGKTFSSPTVRLPTNELSDVARRTLGLLRAAFPGANINAIPAYAEKADHGDLDLLAAQIDGWDAEEVRDILGAVEYKIEGENTAFAVPLSDGRIFQIDIVQLPAASYKFALNYYSMNEVGNFLGVTARMCSFKLGHHGLFYVTRDVNGATVDLPATKSWADAIEFLGYDSKRHAQGVAGGFHSLRDIFDYTISGRYFSKEVYMSQDIGSKRRARISKRPTQQLFLQWLDARPAASLKNFDWSDVDVLKKQFFSEAQERFPLLRESLSKLEATNSLLIDAEAKLAEYRRRFSGSIVSQSTGLVGPELGAYVNAIEASAGGKAALIERVLASTEDEISDLIMAGMPRIKRPSNRP